MTGRPKAVLACGMMLLVGCSIGTSPVASPTTEPSAPASQPATAMPSPSLVSQSPQPSTISAIPDGDYETGHITAAMMTAALKSAGLGDQASGIIAATGFNQYIVFTLRLRSGQYVEFQAIDGGPTEAGSNGVVVSITNDALALQELHAGSPIGPRQKYTFTWTGKSLELDLISGPPGDDLAILTAIYESSPFTRKP